MLLRSMLLPLLYQLKKGVIGYILHLVGQSISPLAGFVQNDYAVDPISAVLKCLCLLQSSTPQSSPEQISSEECRTYDAASVPHSPTPQISLEGASSTLEADKPLLVEETTTRTGLEDDVTNECGTDGAVCIHGDSVGCTKDSVQGLSSGHSSLPFVSLVCTRGFTVIIWQVDFMHMYTALLVIVVAIVLGSQ
jgi:hypothetical protein